MISAPLFLFWTSAGALAYAYAGFPLLVALAGAVRNRRVAKRNVTPAVTIIIAAYNEEDCIEARLHNALAMDYPQGSVEIIIASDGSTDRTEEIVSAFESPAVRLLRLPRRGKIHALAAAVREASGEVLVFSDANIDVEPGAVRTIAANFADPGVGGVVGHTSYRVNKSDESSSRGEDSYWRYDTWIKGLETRTGSVVSAHGGLYAIRKSLFEIPSDSSVTDDFFISTGVVAKGYRLVFEEGARAWENSIPSANREFQRRVRLMTRGFRSLSLRRGLLNPFRYGFYSIVLFSHKVLRRLLPLPLLLLFTSSAWLAQFSAPYAVAFSAQLFFYVLAAAGWAAKRSSIGRMKLLYIPFFYCMANLAALVAMFRFGRGERITLWQPQRHPVQAETS